MNFAAHNTLHRVGQKISWQLVSLVGGIAVSVGAGGLGGAWQLNSTSSATATAPSASRVSLPSIHSYSRPAADPVRSIVYVVGSKAEAFVLEQQVHEASKSYVDPAHRVVFVADTPENKERLNIIVGEQMATGYFDVVDLR
jgi:hypothetical protein